MKTIYDPNNLMLYEGETYERLFSHPEGWLWRRMIGEDDYDYVEDKALCEILDDLFFAV